MSHRRDREAGFTIIEVLVATLFLALVVGAVGTLFVTDSNSSLASQRQSQLIAVADQQIELIRQTVKTSGFASLAMSAAPAAGTNSTLSYSATTHTNPNDLVSATAGLRSQQRRLHDLEATTTTRPTTAVRVETVAAAPSGSGCPAGRRAARRPGRRDRHPVAEQRAGHHRQRKLGDGIGLQLCH